jgi:sugar phosphate isomerase/epimerase
MHDRLCIHPICFAGASFAGLAENWRKLGARRVGLLSSHLRDEGLSAVQATIRSGGYQVETINHVFLPFGRHLEPNEDAWKEPRENLGRVIEEASALGAKSIYTMTGGHGSLTWEDAADCFSAAIAPCVAQAKAAGIALMIENAAPVYADIHLAHSLRDAVLLAERAGIGVCMDFFACWAEAELRHSIGRAIPRCHLVQVCDYVYGDRALPARAVPGDGAIPVKRLIGWILDAGYEGAFDLELLGPRIDTEGHFEAARRAADSVGTILQSLGA